MSQTASSDDPASNTLTNTPSAGQPGDTMEPRAALPYRPATQRPVNGPVFHDITEKFTKACSGLQVGQLVKDEQFTLFESIGALEIMDPKMDAGFLQPGETHEEHYDTLKPLLPEEVIGIMDQLLCYEMAWHTGYPLSQTLLTSVYIDKLLWPEPRLVEDAQFYRGDIPVEKEPGLLLEILRAYCLALVKCCDYAIGKITSRDFFEEEDICTHTYNRVLFVQVSTEVFTEELDNVIQRLQECDTSIIPEDLQLALLVRLKFRKQFLFALDLDCDPYELEAYWSPISSNLLAIESTHPVGRPVKDAFSTKIQRRLASTAPPRPIVVLEFKDAFQKLTQLVADCEEATRVIEVEHDPLESQSFLWAFAGRNPPPLPYARAFLANIYFHPLHQPTDNLRTLLFSELRATVLPGKSPILDPGNWTLSTPLAPSIERDGRLELAKLMDQFSAMAAPAYSEFMIALGQNRCRLRRILCHAILGFDSLQSEAPDIDEKIEALFPLALTPTRSTNSDHVAGGDNDDTAVLLPPYPLSTWAYHKKLHMITRVILLGFEQDIYLPEEFAGLYHFLSIIATTHSNVLKSILSGITSRYDTLIKTVGQSAQTADLKIAAEYFDSLLAEALGTRYLASALSSWYVIGAYSGLLKSPRREIRQTDPRLRYELRMRPFLTLHPDEVPSFDSFDSALHPYGAYDAPEKAFAEEFADPGSALWVGLKEDIKMAKDAWMGVKRFGAASARARGVEKQWEKEVAGVLRSCVALGVGVEGVCRMVADMEKEKGKKDGVEKEKGNSDRDLSLGLKMAIPESDTEKRYSEGWVVGSVVKA